MSDEVKELLEVTKPTVAVRLDLPRRLHAKIKKHWNTLPRTKFEGAVIDILERGLKTLNH